MPRVMELEASFRNNRVFVRAAGWDGHPLTFWTDSGGGAMISPDVVRRLGLTVGPRQLDGERYPAVVDAPHLEEPFPAISGPLIVGDLPTYAEGADGLLGQAWHADRVWTYDYPGRRLYSGNALAAAGHDVHVAALGFLTDGQGRRTNAFPRIEATIDGVVWSFLLDTGATLALTGAAATRLQGALPPLGGTSALQATRS